jgi:plastocyanin
LPPVSGFYVQELPPQVVRLLLIRVPMKRVPIIFLCAMLWLSCSFRTVCAQATVEGKVKLPKPRPADVINKRYVMNGEPAVVVPDPPSAVVYLEGTFPAPQGQPHAEMAQKNLEFVTPLLPVRVGTLVEFPNLDDTYHNIFSYSKPKRFDLGRYRGDEKPVPSQLFDKPGVVALHCDIHEHMRAIILVLESPHFVRTDNDGNYRLEHLPAGHYKLKAWLDSKTTLEREVDLKPGGTLRVDFQ